MARVKRRDYYEVLGVPRDADDASLKRAFRELARRHHPDVNQSDPKAGERFREINEAYATLSSKDLRSRYDRWGHAGPGEATGFGAVAQAVEDVLGDVLRRRRPKQRGRDLRYTLEISFEEAAFGCTKSIQVPDDPDAVTSQPHPPRGRLREFSVVIPPGAAEGSVKTLHGEGEPGKSGGAPGDLHVIIRISAHGTYRREGHDVWTDAVISCPQAALGTVIDVQTLDGKIKMRVPEGSQSGRIFRLRSRGVPRSAGKNALRGDHLVKLSVTVPTDLTVRQRELIDELARALGEERSLAPRRRLIDRVRNLLDE